MGKRAIDQAKGAFLLLFILLLGVASHARGSTGELLENGGFEFLTSEGKAVAWYADFWRPTATFGLTKAISRRGSAAFLHAKEAGDIRLVQTVKVKPETVYRFSGWVAARNVPEKGLGANLCVMGGFVHSAGLRGTTGWTYRELVFKTRPGQTRVTLGIRLGFYGETTTGTAFFDDLSLVELKEPATAYQILGLEEEKPYTPNGEPPALTGESPWGKGPVARAHRAAYSGLIFLFYLLACLPLALRRKEEDLLKPNRWEKKAVLFFLAAAALNVLVRLPLLGAAPFPTDMNCFKAWAMRMAAVGPSGFYAQGYFCDYPPFGLYLLLVPGWLLNTFHLADHPYLANAIPKLPALTGDLLTAWLIFLLLRRKNPRLALFAAVTYMYLPAVIYNSSYLGKVDS
ncbi:MAG: hypothetical protein GX493_09650 [Firmicutes bacterium]|nr:hypothetical protein [Bacillota bacterium]